MDNQEFIDICISKVIEHSKEELQKNDVFIVWSCKTLQNNKAILSYKRKGAPMYEFTHNGDKSEIYMDVYNKESNTCFTV